MTRRAVLSFVVLEAGWFACVWGALHEMSWVGPCVVVGALALHVRHQPSPSTEVVLLVAAAMVGFLVETSFLKLGIVRIVGTHVAPPWLVMLWPNFVAATGGEGPFRALCTRPVLAGLVGAVGGPLAYAAGERFGVIGLGEPRWSAFAILAAVWAPVLPVLLRLRLRVDKT